MTVPKPSIIHSTINTVLLAILTLVCTLGYGVMSEMRVGSLNNAVKTTRLETLLDNNTGVLVEHNEILDNHEGRIKALESNRRK
jgi:hypothetical protein